MNPALHRRHLLQWAAAVGPALLALPASAHEYFTPNLRISHPWCRATPADAPFAIVNMTFEEVALADHLIGVETPVATAVEMGGPTAGAAIDIAIPAGREFVLGEDGLFIRLVGLKQALELGRSYPLRLVFAQGGEVNATLDVAYGQRS